MEYVELNISATGELAEILTAELAEFDFDSFKQEGTTLKAYIPRDSLFDCKEQIDSLLESYKIENPRYIHIESQNWNALWESNFSPVDVDGKIYIRAPFHSPCTTSALEVVIMPKMSFGTGHHATTCLVSSYLWDMELTHKRGLDMGSGTGVLAIIAAKRGAEVVDAVDIDEWADENCRENISTNGVEDRVNPMLGDVRAVAGRKYDFIAANINRNILTGDMAAYAELMNSGAEIVMSGFLEEDIAIISASAEESGLKVVDSRLRGGWAALRCKKE